MVFSWENPPCSHNGNLNFNLPKIKTNAYRNAPTATTVSDSFLNSKTYLLSPLHAVEKSITPLRVGCS